MRTKYICINNQTKKNMTKRFLFLVAVVGILDFFITANIIVFAHLVNKEAREKAERKESREKRFRYMQEHFTPSLNETK